MADSSRKLLLASFWDSMNDLSPRKKQSQPLPALDSEPETFARPYPNLTEAASPFDSTPSTVTASNNSSSVPGKEDKKPQVKQHRGAEKRENEAFNHAQDTHASSKRGLVGVPDTIATASTSARAPKRGRFAAGILSSKSSALGLPSRSSSSLPKLSASQSSSHSQSLLQQQSRGPQAPSSCLPLPNRLGRLPSTTASRRPFSLRAAAPKTMTSPHLSLDPYDVNSIIMDDDAELQQEQEVGTPTASQSGSRTSIAPRSGRKPRQSGKKTPQSEEKESSYYEVERIVDFRRIEDHNLENEYGIELLVHWSGYNDPDDHTWEDEDELQLTARDAVLKFWKTHPKGGRDAALRINASDGGTPYRALRVVGGPKVYRKNVMHKAKGIKAQQPVKDETAMTAHKLFQVEWVGYKEKTWEPRENLPEDMIRVYLDSQNPRGH